MDRLLITGANGFIGRHCLPLLTEHYEVHCITSRQRHEALAPSVTWHQSDLLNPADVSEVMVKVQPQFLLHLAWITEHGVYWTSPRNIEWAAASAYLFVTFARYGGRRLVTAGTCAEYDWAFGLCDEYKTPMKPATPYGKSKYALSILQSTFAPRLADGAAWLRIFHLYGPGEGPKRFVPTVIRSLLANQPALTTAGTQVRDMMYVKDVASAFVTLLASNGQGEVNLGTGEPIRLHEVAVTIGEQIGKLDLLKLGAIPIAPNDPPVLLPTVQRLHEELGWKPHYTLLDALSETIQHWVDAGSASSTPDSA